MNASFYRRLWAFITDMFILGLVITMSLQLFSGINKGSISLLNEDLKSINRQLIEDEIEMKDYIYQYADITKKVDKLEIVDNLLNFIYIIMLFVYIPFFLKGQTLGMKLAKIKVVKSNGDKARMLDYLFRSLLIYMLGYLLITITCLFLVSSLTYLIVSIISAILVFLLVIISTFMILYRNDQRGLHDILTRTKIIRI